MSVLVIPNFNSGMKKYTILSQNQTTWSPMHLRFWLIYLFCFERKDTSARVGIISFCPQLWQDVLRTIYESFDYGLCENNSDKAKNSYFRIKCRNVGFVWAILIYRNKTNTSAAAWFLGKERNVKQWAAKEWARNQVSTPESGRWLHLVVVYGQVDFLVFGTPLLYGVTSSYQSHYV